MQDPVDRSKAGVDINALYAPATAPTEVERPEAREEAALGRSGANGLLAVTIIEFIGTTVTFFVISREAPDPVTMVFAYGVVAIFAGLYVWARSNPYPACITGLGLYLTIHALAAIADPISLTSGILIKIVVISVLARSINNIYSLRKFSRE